MRPLRDTAIALATVATCAGLLGACGSGSSSSAVATGKAASCQQVSAVLSDGPDPTADPVGYAEAQVLPLRDDVRTSDESLHTAVDNLASAYERFFAANGSTAASQAVDRAVKQVNTICPGAA